MLRPIIDGLRGWVRPERRWRGEHALVKAETCYRILEVASPFVGILGCTAVALVYALAPAVVSANPIVWAVFLANAALVPGSVFRGWPFRLRAGLLIFALLVTTLGSATELGPTPNWAFLVIVLVGAASLFYGARTGIALVAGLAAAHLVIAVGWTTGQLPVFMGNIDTPKRFLNPRSIAVWIRVVLLGFGLASACVLAMRFILDDLNDALRDSNYALRQLAAEQERRARAEESKMLAEREKREAQKFDALGRLASGVAHDFNNALCVMKIWSSYLLDGGTPEEVREAMAEIRAATENAEHLTRHLLAFSRNEPATRQVANLSEVVAHDSRTLGRLLPKNIVVETRVDDSLHVPLGKGQLEEIILNLSINSRDAMPAGGRLTLWVARETLEVSSSSLPPGSYAKLVVTDTGQGMDEATASRIFEPFFTTKGVGDGTGLGLSMVYGLVSGAGGHVSVKSRPGDGTTFTILLPLVGGEQLRTEAARLPVALPRQCRVLFVDGHSGICALVERILSEAGFPTIMVPSGQAALLAMDEPGSRFGLLIIQGVMAGVSTRDVIARARRDNPDCRVIVISAPALEKELLDGIDCRDYHPLVKPFDADRVMAVVGEALSTAVVDRRPAKDAI